MWNPLGPQKSLQIRGGGEWFCQVWLIHPDVPGYSVLPPDIFHILSHKRAASPGKKAWNFTIHCIIGVGWNVSLGDLGIAHSRVKCHTTRSWISDPLPFLALWLGCSSTPNLRLAGAAELWESESPTQLRWFPATGSWPRQLSCFSAVTTGSLRRPSGSHFKEF